jgi:hypothetical protein
MFLPGDVDQYEQMEIIQQLERTKPKLIIYGRSWNIDGKPFHTYAPLIHDYIEQQWHLEKKYGIYEIYVHN